jgi:hypothetical protein
MERTSHKSDLLVGSRDFFRSSQAFPQATALTVMLSKSGVTRARQGPQGAGDHTADYHFSTTELGDLRPERCELTLA